MPKCCLVVNEELVRGQILERDEYKIFYKVKGSNVTKKKNYLIYEEYLERELLRHWILFTANSRLRSVEQRQMKWQNLSLEVE